MFNWAKQQLAHVAGTQEPEYGPEAIQTVTEQAKKTPFTLLSKQDQKWITPDSSCVETQTFYIHTDAGPFAFVQVIYSNVAIKTTVQFNTQIYYLDDKTPALWCSDPVDDWSIDKERYSFKADKCSIELSADGDSYTIKSSTNLKAIVNITVSRSGPGFVAGTNGTSYYGTDASKPWGSMRHSFWPRCEVKGSILTKAGEVKVDGTGTYVQALQGMKPQHAAAKWNFVDWHSPTLSALMMEFTTPPSYANTVVNVGAITTASSPPAILIAGANNTAEHTKTEIDKDVDWPEPTSVKYTWKGTTAEGKPVTAVLEGDLGKRVDRVDVMGELPGFVKSIASQASGTRPYIYQYLAKMPLVIKVEGEEERREEGLMFGEATFIS